jgi:hypothetical protein
MIDHSIIAEWPVNKRERVRVSIEKFKGVDLINLRKWFLADNDDTLRPGKGGIALNVKHLPKLVDAIVKALAVAMAQALCANHLPMTGLHNEGDSPPPGACSHGPRAGRVRCRVVEGTPGLRANRRREGEICLTRRRRRRSSRANLANVIRSASGEDERT